MTSAHCLNNLFKLLGDLGAVNRNASTTVFFFGFQSPLREGNVRPTEEQSLSGANLVGYNENTDMCLLRIKGLPRRANGTLGPIPAAYQPTSLGGISMSRPKVPSSVSTILGARPSATTSPVTPSCVPMTTTSPMRISTAPCASSRGATCTGR